MQRSPRLTVKYLFYLKTAVLNAVENKILNDSRKQFMTTLRLSILPYLITKNLQMKYLMER